MNSLRHALDGLAEARPDRARQIAEFQAQLLNSEAFAIATVAANGAVQPETLEPQVVALAVAAARDGVAVAGRGAASSLSAADDGSVQVAVHRLAQDSQLAQALARERLELVRAVAGAHAAATNPAVNALLLQSANADWTDDSLHQLALHVADLTGAPRVALAMARQRRVIRVADSQHPRPALESRRALELAAGEAVDDILAAPHQQGSGIPGFTGLERLGDGAALGVASALSANGDGLVVITWPPGDRALAAAFADRAAPMAVARMYRPTLAARFDRLAVAAPWPGSVDRADRPRLARRVLAGLLLAVLLLPVPDSIRAPLSIEPRLRRVVTAPLSARIEEVAVDPGDDVRAGQVLVRFDPAQIARDHEEATAALQAASTQAAAARADGDVEGERLAQLKAAQFAGQVALLDARLAETVVRAPIAGTINGEDMRRRVGATMNRGDTLFSVAAPGGYRADLLIGDADVARVKPGARVSMRLVSRPLARIGGKVVRIYPLAEVVDGRNVFRTLVSIDTDDKGDLRAGMSGTASVRGGWAPVAWQAIRPAIRWVRMQLWL